MKTNIFAFTETGHAPGLVSINRLDNGNVEISLRQSPKRKDGIRVCGADCQPGEKHCNNYCAHDKSKPIAGHPERFEYDEFGVSAMLTIPGPEFDAALSPAKRTDAADAGSEVKK